MHLLTSVLAIIIIPLLINTAHGEFYDGGVPEDGYYEDHRTFESVPDFCIVDYFDHEDGNSDTSDYLFNETIRSISEWDDAIKIYYYSDWENFSISLVDGYDITSTCNTYIYFIEGDAGNTLGKTYQWGDILLIYIYHETIDDIKDVHYIIKHEIGHALGLGHRSPHSSYFSIMTPDLKSYQDYDPDWISVIDAYSVYKIYGKDGFSIPNS